MESTTTILRGAITNHGVPVTASRGNGYIAVNIAGKQLYAHRVAWLFVHGRWPVQDIDHINRDKRDNRIANLREATRSQNQQNHPLLSTNTSGHKSVRFNVASRRWVAYIRVNKRPKHLGSFTSLEDALAAHQRAEAEHFGEFAYREVS